MADQQPPDEPAQQQQSSPQEQRTRTALEIQQRVQSILQSTADIGQDATTSAAPANVAELRRQATRLAHDVQEHLRRQQPQQDHQENDDESDPSRE